MLPTKQHLFSVGAILSACGVMIAAVATHIFSDSLSAKELNQLRLSGEYLIYGGGWIMILAIAKSSLQINQTATIGLIIGLLIFCGALFLGPICHAPQLLQITPFGGLTIIGSLMWIGVDGIRKKTK